MLTQTEYPMGTRVVITGDTMQWGHQFKVGEEGTLDHCTADSGCGFRVRGLDGVDDWYVHINDMTLLSDIEGPPVEPREYTEPEPEPLTASERLDLALANRSS